MLSLLWASPASQRGRGGVRMRRRARPRAAPPGGGTCRPAHPGPASGLPSSPRSPGPVLLPPVALKMLTHNPKFASFDCVEYTGLLLLCFFSRLYTFQEKNLNSSETSCPGSALVVIHF